FRYLCVDHCLAPCREVWFPGRTAECCAYDALALAASARLSFPADELGRVCSEACRVTRLLADAGSVFLAICVSGSCPSGFGNGIAAVVDFGPVTLLFTRLTVVCNLSISVLRYSAPLPARSSAVEVACSRRREISRCVAGTSWFFSLACASIASSSCAVSAQYCFRSRARTTC